MTVNTPGDALPCSIPEANAEKLQRIGTRSPDALDVTAAKPIDPNRAVPVPANPTVGGQIDLHV